MSNATLSTAPRISGMVLRTFIATLIVLGFITLFMGARGMAYVGQSLAHAQLHAPRLDLIAAAPAAIQIHLASVAAAVVLATVQMVGPKGRTMHRVLGWTLAILLVITAIASLFIRNPNGGLFNPFQLFSVWTLVAIPLALIAARRHNVLFHARMMTGFYFGGLILAGALTFLPGRLMWRVFFG
jgi:uncharacterized membrane protein